MKSAVIQEVERRREEGEMVFSPKKIADSLASNGHPVTRQYVYSVLKKEQIPTGRSRKSNPCVYCKKPVRVARNNSPYDKHARCWERHRKRRVKCDNCGVMFRKSPSQIKRGRHNFHNRACRDAGQAKGIWRGKR